MGETIKRFQEFLREEDCFSYLRGIRRGVERECLRINSSGRISNDPHPESLGKALTHPNITTDYSEALLEFITPVLESETELLKYLENIQKFTLKNLGEENLWITSMPCPVESSEEVPIAYYGESNIGKMKTIYRKGLKNRYGSMMQVIAGVHFNFSMPNAFWPLFRRFKNSDLPLDQFISQSYFGLIRNVHRFGWVTAYLFGASPVLCDSFLKAMGANQLPYLKEMERGGGVYAPFGTSLRLSDLGYQNDTQGEIKICYNSLESYMKGLLRVINSPSAKWEELGLKDGDGNYKQLNTNILQIENEYYGPIRPKRVTPSGHSPGRVLRTLGVEYVELRSLDINPFDPVGISLEQVQFLDVFLVYCLIKPSAPYTLEDSKKFKENNNRIVLRGREEGLKLWLDNKEVPREDFLEMLFEGLNEAAVLLDKSYKTDKYANVIAKFKKTIPHPELTYSGQLMAGIEGSGKSYFAYFQDLAKKYRNSLLETPLSDEVQKDFLEKAHASVQKQEEVERKDNLSFEEYVHRYFNGD